MNTVTIDAAGLHYTLLNREIRKAVEDGADEIIIRGVLGQRFIADGLTGTVTIRIQGVPGGDLGMFMNGPKCFVSGNCEHAPGNTMDAGEIIIHGNAGDAVAHSMRGGEIYVRDDIGYRGGIHMKQYQGKRPVLVIGGTTRAFLGEYMAGGLIIVLGMGASEPVRERGVGSGIHGGEIIIRRDLDEKFLGVGARKLPLGEDEKSDIALFIQKYCTYFNRNPDPLLSDSYIRVVPSSSRPFAGKYTWE